MWGWGASLVADCLTMKQILLGYSEQVEGIPKLDQTIEIEYFS